MPEIFNKKMDEVVCNSPGVVKSMDDFLVYGKNQEQHDFNLRQFLHRLADNGVTLNTEKCSFSQSEVEFLGHKVSAEGVKPLTVRLQAIRDFRVPNSLTELRSFLGMAQQVARYFPEFSKVAEPLRELLSTKSHWTWTAVHETAFNNVKEILVSPPILAHYDISKPTKIRTDGSLLHGISVILYQQHDNKWKPVDCASRFITTAERNYYPIELEMLAVTWGCRKMAKYLQGLPEFFIETDHKPLVPILNSKPIAEMSPRIQRLRMKLLGFQFTASYIPGKELSDADALSRAPVSEPNIADELAETELTTYVQSIVDNLPASNDRLHEIRKHTSDDIKLQQLIGVLRTGWPDLRSQCPVDVQPYWDFRDAITYLDGLILNGTRIIIPTNLRRNILKSIHDGHLGVVKCKQRARQSVYWPRLNTDIENLIKKCDTCSRYQRSNSHDPLITHEVPEAPWEKVGTDLFQLGGKDYLIVVDYYSLWPEVYVLSKTTSKFVIDATKDTFARHGIPKVVISDNGPQYSSWQYRHFAREWKFHHRTSSPRYPRSNGLAEATVKTVKNIIRKCHMSNTDIYKGLLAYRNTPLSCGKSPAQLIFNHPLQDSLPRIEQQKQGHRPVVTERNAIKEWHDNRKPITTSTAVYHPNQLVAVQDDTTREWTRKGRIVREVEPRSYEIRLDNGRLLRRNI